MKIKLHHGHVYRAALHLSGLESAFSGQIVPELEKVGFSHVRIWSDRSEVPSSFGKLRTMAQATHWAEAIYDGKEGEQKDLPPQVLVVRDDGTAVTSPVLPPGSPQWMPPRPGGSSMPTPRPGESDPACLPGYTRLSPNSPCIAVVPPGFALQPGSENAPRSNGPAIVLVTAVAVIAAIGKAVSS